MVMADPDTRKLYENAAKAKGQPVFSLTVADFFHAPSVDEVDLAGYNGQPGDPIVILARDDFGVSAVGVEVSGVDGSSIESGAAVEVPASSGRWVYSTIATVTTGTQVRIVVTAEDRPGGKGSNEAQKTL